MTRALFWDYSKHSKNERRRAFTAVNMSNFLFSVGVVLPIFVLLLLGFFLKKIKFVDGKFIDVGNKLCFKIFLPALLFMNIYQTDVSEVLNFRFVLFSVTAIIIAIIIYAVVISRTVKDRPKAAVIIQAAYRSNFIIFALPLADMIGVSNATSVISMLLAFIVPLFNLSAVLVLMIFGEAYEKSSPKEIVKEIITNPLIVAAALGFVLHYVGLNLPEVILKPVHEVSKIATPFALILMGANFEMKSARSNIRYIVPGTVLRLLVTPGIIIPIGALFNFNAPEMVALMTLTASPCAVSSYTMAHQYGADSDLAGELVVSTTLFSSVTIVMFIYFLKTFGLI